MSNTYSMRLAHDICGEGPPLLLLHGVIHRRHAWDPVIDLLTPHRRVITVDLPGHGDSPEMPDGPDPLRACGEALSEFLARVAPGEKVHVAGNSLGGWLALEAAAQGTVASATAFSPAGFFTNSLDQRRVLSMFRMLRWTTHRLGDRRDALMENTAGRTAAMAVFFAKPSRVSAEVAKIDAKSLLDNKLISRALDVDFAFTPMVDPDIPITVAWGRRDLVVPYWQARGVRRAFPSADVTVYPRLGHVPMYDDPRLVAQILLDGSAGHATLSDDDSSSSDQLTQE